MKRLADILFVFGCLSILTLVWWQPEIVSLQAVAGIPDRYGVPFRWLIPCLAFCLSGFSHCVENARADKRETQGRTAISAVTFGVLSMMVSIMVLPSLLWLLLIAVFTFVFRLSGIH